MRFASASVECAYHSQPQTHHTQITHRHWGRHAYTRKLRQIQKLCIHWLAVYVPVLLLSLFLCRSFCHLLILLHRASVSFTLVYNKPCGLNKVGVFRYCMTVHFSSRRIEPHGLTYRDTLDCIQNIVRRIVDD